MNSLRLRLFSFLLGLAALAALVVGGSTYFSVRAEADELFDYHLRQMALGLGDQGRIPEDERAALTNPDFDYVVQIWSVDGVALYRSQPQDTLVFPVRTVIGFSNVQVGGETWRVYGTATPLRVIQVGQRLAVRRGLATAAAGRSVLPIVAAAPAIGLAMWWLLGYTLAPLAPVVAAARARDAASLDPLPEAGLPDEIRPLVAAFNLLLHRLRGAFDAQRSFVADAAHELRTPLTALKLQLGMLRDAADGPPRDAALQRLREGVDRAARLVDQLLTLARAEPGHAPALAAVDLAEVARQAVADAAALAVAHGAQVELDAPDACWVRGDSQALRSVARNLVDNAIVHAGGRVRVSTASEADGIVLTVDDSGPGIPPAERERVFDRFHRGADGGREGSGLGLAIVRAIAVQHGGEATLGDSPIGGLRAQVRLPASENAAA